MRSQTETTISLGREPAAPGHARDALERVEHGLPERRLEDARLMLSELVTNAVKYGGEGDLRVELSRRTDFFRAEVTDGGDGFDARAREARGRDPRGPGGWGLHLVERLADRWGSFEASTHVWFELAVQR